MAAKEDSKASLKAEAEAAIAPQSVSTEPGTKDQTKADAQVGEIADDVPPTPPPKPARPASPFSASLAEITEAFPEADVSVRRAVLVAARGDLEQAFNGLLALTDDTIRPPPAPPQLNQRQSQIDKDEEMARQLASRYSRRGSERGRGAGQQQQAQYTDSYPREGEGAAAGDMDFQEIRENIQRGWGETTKRVGTLFNQLRDRINNELNSDREAEDELYEPPRRYRQEPFQDPRSATGAQGTPPPKPPRPARAVNAFGDEIPPRWEPLRTENKDSTTAQGTDAFFIGESDDDLDSLDEAATAPSKKADKAEAKDVKSTDAKDKLKAEEVAVVDSQDDAAKTDPKSAAKEDVKAESKESKKT